MKPETIADLIAQKNKQTQADRNRQFARRASDTQVLDHMTKAARVAVDAYFSNSRDCAEAMKELRKFVVLSERRK